MLKICKHVSRSCLNNLCKCLSIKGTNCSVAPLGSIRRLSGRVVAKTHSYEGLCNSFLPHYEASLLAKYPTAINYS